MKLEAGCTYICENGYQVTVQESGLPYYKFKSILTISDEGTVVSYTEKFNEDGIAYHNDCGYNVVRKV